MPTSFASYDLDQNGTISPDEWSQFYAMDEGPASGGGYGSRDPRAGGEMPVEAAPFDLEDFIARVSAGNFTDDDMLAFSNWYMGQQLGQQAGQMQYQNDYLLYLNDVLQGDQQKLAVAKQEMDFQQGPYWDWYVNTYFPHQQQRDQMDFDLAGLNLDTQRYLSDNQKAIADIEQGKATDYALAQFYGTEQAQLGADAARWQYLQMLETPRQSASSRSLGSY